MKTNIHIELIKERVDDFRKKFIFIVDNVLNLFQDIIPEKMERHTQHTILAIARAEVERLEGEQQDTCNCGHLEQDHNVVGGSGIHSKAQIDCLHCVCKMYRKTEQNIRQSSIDHWREVIKEFE